jgi:hypothetical protein
MSGSSNGHADLTLARTPSRLRAESGSFAHLAGSTTDSSIAATIRSSLSQAGSTAAAILHVNPTRNSLHPGKADTTKSGGGGSKSSLLDGAVRYFLNGDANPDRSAEEI